MIESRPHEEMKEQFKNEVFVRSVGDAGNALVVEVDDRASSTFGNTIRDSGWVPTQVVFRDSIRFVTFAPLNEVLGE